MITLQFKNRLLPIGLRKFLLQSAWHVLSEIPLVLVRVTICERWLVYHKLIPCPRHVKSQHPLGHARDPLVIAGFSMDGATLVMTAMLAFSLLYHLCWGCSSQNICKCFLDGHSHPGSEFWSLRDRNLRQHEEKLTDMVPVTSPNSDHPAPNQQRGFSKCFI